MAGLCKRIRVPASPIAVAGTRDTPCFQLYNGDVKKVLLRLLATLQYIDVRDQMNRPQGVYSDGVYEFTNFMCFCHVGQPRRV